MLRDALPVDTLPRRARWRRLTPEQAHASTLPAQARRVKVTLAGREWIITLLPASGPWTAQAVQLSAQWEGLRCQAIVTTTGLETLLKPWLGPVGLEDLGQPLLLAMLQDLMDQALAQRSTSLEGMRLDLGPQEGASPKVEWTLRLTPVDADADAEGVAVRLRADPAMGRWLAAQMGRRPPDLQPWRALPIRSTVELGWVDLPLAELRSLRPQDVVLPDYSWTTATRREALIRIAPRFGIRVGRDDDGMLHALTGVEPMEQQSMRDSMAPNDRAGEDTGQPAALSEITLRLSFDLGHLETTLGDLSSVTVGHVFNLGLAPQAAVQLRINGWHVGEGEIVEIGDRLGIAVTRFSPPNA